MRVYLVDGTYELFRHYYGHARTASGRDVHEPGEADELEVAATRGVVSSVVSMLAEGSTHLGVATDHVVESFRNDLWQGYKTSAGVPADLLAQFPLLESALRALGVVVWAMVELEADDALSSAAAVAADDPAVDQVVVCTPDKDLAQCVVDRRVVQLDRRTGTVTDEEGVWARFGVAPASIPDWLALVGDSADGFPGLPGWGKRSASTVLAHYGHLDAVPDRLEEWDPSVRRSLRGAAKLADVLATGRPLAERFLELATLRVDRSLLQGAEQLRWSGPTAGFPEICGQLRAPGLAARVAALRST